MTETRGCFVTSKEFKSEKLGLLEWAHTRLYNKKSLVKNGFTSSLKVYLRIFSLEGKGVAVADRGRKSGENDFPHCLATHSLVFAFFFATHYVVLYDTNDLTLKQSVLSISSKKSKYDSRRKNWFCHGDCFQLYAFRVHWSPTSWKKNKVTFLHENKMFITLLSCLIANAMYNTKQKERHRGDKYLRKIRNKKTTKTIRNNANRVEVVCCWV